MQQLHYRSTCRIILTDTFTLPGYDVYEREGPDPWEHDIYGSGWSAEQQLPARHSWHKGTASIGHCETMAA